MKILVQLLLFTTLLSANFLKMIDNYRKGNPWQEELDKFLYSDIYLDYLLKDKDVKFGYYDKPTNLIICFKDKRELEIYSYNKKLFFKKEFKRILVGKNRGDKWTEGDGKTPIGVYNLQYKIDDDKLDDFYGPLAYPTNYPNLYDHYRGKNGHGIWIHGFPKDNPKRSFDTKGCIAIPNDKLLELSKSIDYRNSILIISTNRLPTTTKSEIKTILKNIFKWRYAWKYNKLKEYLSFYDKKHFKKENRFGYKYFAFIKQKIFAKQKNKILKFNNLQIIPYPSINKDIYKVSFDEYFQSGDKKFIGQKTLYLKLKGDKISIFLEN